ncbi:MAG: hypothetical protein ABL984_18480 [Pyrinomonadaceae bacterium]
MKITRNSWLWIVLGMALFLVAESAGQAQTEPRSPQPSGIFGSNADGKYRNSSLGFELTVPTNWVSLSQDEQDKAKGLGADGLKAQDGGTAKEIDLAVGAETVVLAYAKKPLGALGNSVWAVGVGKQPSSRITPSMVVEAAKSLFLKAPENKLIKDVEVEKIDGKEFASMVIDLYIHGQTVRLRYYATMIREFSVTVNMTASDADSLKEAETALRSFKITQK